MFNSSGTVVEGIINKKTGCSVECVRDATVNDNPLDGGFCEPVYDSDDNKYETIRIGTQVWTLQNLLTTHYNNGDPIPYVESANDWSNLSSGGYCNCDEDEESIMPVSQPELIPEVTDNAAWAALETGARCAYNNDHYFVYPPKR